MMGKIRSSNRVEVAADAAYAIDPDVDGLLLNWGKWLQGRKGGASLQSGMWRFASRGTRDVAYATVSAVPVDNDQASRVEVVVCNPQFSPKLRDILKAHYVVNAHPNRTCTALGLHHASYPEWAWRAATYFGNRYRMTYRLTVTPLGC